MKIYIYVLKDPRTNIIRYVGKTCNLKKRYNSHCCIKSLNKESNHRKYWLTSIIKAGYLPIMEPIEECGDDWQEREIYWIKYYKDLGLNLVNSTDGGDGSKYFQMSEAVKAKISSSKKGIKLSEETRKRMSIAQKGKSKAKWKYPRVFSEEHKNKLKLAAKGKSNMVGKTHKSSWYEKMCRKVIDTVTMEIFINYQYAAKSYNIPHQTLYRWLKNDKLNKTNLKYYDSQI